MYIDEFAAQRIARNDSGRRQPERPAQTIARHWHADAAGRAARTTRPTTSWLRLFRAS